jgi:Flp pilus assembly protein TadG
LKATRLQHERGASAVEFAIVASLLLVILFGTIQFGITFNRYQGVQAAAREGARLGSLPSTDADAILQRVKDSVSILNPATISGPPCNPASVTLNTGCVQIQRITDSGTTTMTSGSDIACSNATSGQNPKIRVELHYRVRIDIPLWASPQVTLRAGGEFRCENAGS